MTAKKEKKRRRRKSEYLPNMTCVHVAHIPHVLKVKPAKEGISFVREMKHVIDGDPQECASCANAKAGQDAGIAPWCISLDTRYYGVHKWVKTRKGSYGLATVWNSKQGKFQRAFDQDKEGLLKSPEAVGVVRLSPYRVRQRPKGPKSVPGRPSGRDDGSRAIKDPGYKGSLKRMRRSGLGVI